MSVPSVTRRRNNPDILDDRLPSPVGSHKRVSSQGRNAQIVHLIITCTLLVLVVFQFLTRHVKVEPEKPTGIHPQQAVDTVPAVALQATTKEMDLLKEQLNSVQKENTDLRSEVSHLTTQQQKQPTLTKSDVERFQKRDKAMSEQIHRLESSLKIYSRNLLRHEFGQESTTAFVELRVRFPASMGEPAEESLVLETAPFDVIPTSVYFWLKQVDLGLWDGCSFFRNARHVLQASSRTPGGGSNSSKFRDSGHPASIPFQEYSSRFTHRKYTLGLAGRPGGPDFYISTENNVRNHGPGGQGAYDMVEEADSAFGQLITQDEGASIRVAERMHTAAVKSGSFKEMKEYIEIVSAKVLREHDYHSETSV